MDRARLGFACLLHSALLLSCSGTTAQHGPGPDASAPRTSSQGASEMIGGFIRHPGSPDPLACRADADCVYGQTFDDSGCCGTFRDMAATAQSKAYQEHVQGWREAHCKEHACPSPPVPSEPPACLFDVHCVQMRCVNACE